MALFRRRGVIVLHRQGRRCWVCPQLWLPRGLSVSMSDDDEEHHCSKGAGPARVTGPSVESHPGRDDHAAAFSKFTSVENSGGRQKGVVLSNLGVEVSPDPRWKDHQ
jgi:hypothetical protein